MFNKKSKVWLGFLYSFHLENGINCLWEWLLIFR